MNDWGDWQPPAEVETPLTDRLMNWAKQSATGRRARYGQAARERLTDGHRGSTSDGGSGEGRHE